MRECPACGHANDARASWCALCLTRFGAAATTARPEGPATVRLPLFQASHQTRRVLASVGIALAGLVGAVAITGGLLLLQAIFSLWGGDVDVVVPSILGGVILVGGVVLAVLVYRANAEEPRLEITADELVIHHPAWRHAFRVARAQVRLVTVDDRPGTDRFPVEGDVPEGATTDLLDVLTGGVHEVKVPRDPVQLGARAPAQTEHDPGWVLGDGADRSIMSRPMTQRRLSTAHGAALPMLRLNPGDVPNVAVLFTEELRQPPGAWFGVGGPRAIFGRRGLPDLNAVRGGAPARGLLGRVADPAGASAAFGAWDVVRVATADDILDLELRVPRPLRGWRLAAAAALILVPVVLDVLTRRV